MENIENITPDDLEQNSGGSFEEDNKGTLWGSLISGIVLGYKDSGKTYEQAVSAAKSTLSSFNISYSDADVEDYVRRVWDSGEIII